METWSGWFRLVISILATWRLAHLVAHEDGPFDLVVRVRKGAGNSVFGQLMDCPFCLSIWFAIPFAFLIGHGIWAWIAAWLAISGGASVLEKLTARADSMQD